VGTHKSGDSYRLCNSLGLAKISSDERKTDSDVSARRRLRLLKNHFKDKKLDVPVTLIRSHENREECVLVGSESKEKDKRIGLISIYKYDIICC
jgi:hypothetical protein